MTKRLPFKGYIISGDGAMINGIPVSEGTYKVLGRIIVPCTTKEFWTQIKKENESSDLKFWRNNN